MVAKAKADLIDVETNVGTDVETMHDSKHLWAQTQIDRLGRQIKDNVRCIERLESKLDLLMCHQHNTNGEVLVKIL